MEKTKDKVGEPLKMSRVLHLDWVLPDNFFDEELTEEAFAQEIKEEGVLKLFQKGRISSGYGAKMLGISRREFLDLLAKHRIPYINYSEKELLEEIDAGRKLADLIPDEK